MKKPIALFLLAILLSACSPSAQAIQTAIAQTQAANPTSTFTYIPPTETLTRTPTITPTPGSVVIYSDNFSDSQSGWEQTDSNGSKQMYQDGQYLYIIDSGLAFTCAHHDFANGVLTIDVKQNSGDSATAGAVVVWRQSDNGEYWLWLKGDGSFTITKVTFTGSTSQKIEDLYDSPSNPAINIIQQINHVVISFNGENSTIYINNKMIVGVKDSSFLTGDICLGAGAFTSRVEIAFDNLVVYTIDSWTPPIQIIPTQTTTETVAPTSIFTPTKTKIPTKIPTPTKPPNLAQTSTALQIAYLRADKPDGNYLVGVDIAPGVWRNNGIGDCYWELTTRTGDIIKNYFGSGGGTAYISSTAFSFRSEYCNNWTFLSPP